MPALRNAKGQFVSSGRPASSASGSTASSTSAGRSGTKVTLVGFDYVLKKLKALEPKIRRQVVKQAEKNALGIPKSQAGAVWPIKTGRSKRSIRIRVSKGPRGAPKGTVAMALLVGQGKQTKSQKAKGTVIPWWSFLIEFGWQIGKRIKARNKEGKLVVVSRYRRAGMKSVPGKHILRKALRATESRVKQVLTDEILKGIEREVSS